MEILLSDLVPAGGDGVVDLFTRSSGATEAEKRR